jgi:hypothetical protein
MGYSHFKKPTATQGLYVGTKGNEVILATSAGVLTPTAVTSGVKTSERVTLSSSSAADTAYAIIPIAGNITAVYSTNTVADIKGIVWGLTHGSAGATAASVTTTTAANVIGTVTTWTLSSGSVAVTAGESVCVTRATTGTATANVVTIVVNRTS